MTLQVRDLTWSTLKKQATVKMVLPIVERVPLPIKASPHLSEMTKANDYIPNMHCEWDQPSELWCEKTNLNRACNPAGVLLGRNYTEGKSGLFTKKNELITNAHIKVTGRLQEFVADNKEPNEFLLCEVTVPTWKQPRVIQIPLKAYKKCFLILHEQYPDIQLSSRGQDALEEYLTDIFQNVKSVPLSVRTMKSGWFDIDGRVSYYIGSDEFYSQSCLPDVAGLNRTDVFWSGVHFLDISEGYDSLDVLFLFAHMAYSLYWMRRGGTDISSVLFLQGATGSFKTTLVRKLANIFDQSNQKDKETVSFGSTWPSVQRNIALLTDAVCAIDDYSNSEAQTSRDALKLAEMIIRAVGDGHFPIKMNMADGKHVFREGIRSAVIFTGEESFNLGVSSTLRMITVSLDRNQIDTHVLQEVKRTDLALYFSLYVAFLSENGSALSAEVSKAFDQYRNAYAKSVPQTPRLADTAAGYSIQIKWLLTFAAWCGVDESRISSMGEAFTKAIEKVVVRNYHMANMDAPEVRFLYALFQQIGNTDRNRLAPDETVYVEAEAHYIGFRNQAEDTVWLRFDDAYDLVVRYYQKLQQSWLTKPGTVKRLLLKSGLSVGHVAVKGVGAEYLIRARKGTRKRMLVLHYALVEKVLATMKGEF